MTGRSPDDPGRHVLWFRARDAPRGHRGRRPKGRTGHLMYGWIWRHLPGNTLLRTVQSLVLFLAVVYVLFQWVFPWAEPLLPFNDVTVDES